MTTMTTSNSVKEIKAELQARGIAFRAKAKKEELLMLLNQDTTTLSDGTIVEEKPDDLVNPVAGKQVEERKAEPQQEQKAEPKRPDVDPELMAETVASQIDGAEVIAVKPNGFGVKLGKTRAFAIYRNRTNHFRVKTNKVEQALGLLTGTEEVPGYDATIGFKLTSDGRDALLDFNFQQDDTVEAFLVDLCQTDMSRKKRAKKAEQAAPEAEQAEEQAETK